MQNMQSYEKARGARHYVGSCGCRAWRGPRSSSAKSRQSQRHPGGKLTAGHIPAAGKVRLACDAWVLERGQLQHWPQPGAATAEAADRDDARSWYDIAVLSTYLSLGSQNSEAPRLETETH